jgi:hypothetical protein
MGGNTDEALLQSKRRHKSRALQLQQDLMAFVQRPSLSSDLVASPSALAPPIPSAGTSNDLLYEALMGNLVDSLFFKF